MVSIMPWLMRIFAYIGVATTITAIGILAGMVISMLQDAIDERRGYAVGRMPRRRGRVSR